MNTKHQYTMTKNQETKTVTPNLNLHLSIIKLFYSTRQPLYKITLSGHHHLPLLSGRLIHTTLTCTANYPPVTYEFLQQTVS